MAQSGHVSTIAELGTRTSESTAPSTPFSTGKRVGSESPQKTAWLGRFLVKLHVMRKEHQEPDEVGMMAAKDGNEGSMEKTGSNKYEKVEV